MTRRTALVTGVVGGIGAGIAKRLAADGARVIVSDVPGDALNEAAEKLRMPSLSADLGDPSAVQEMLHQ